MRMIIMTLDFQLPGCRSLKDKRHRLRGLKDRFGKLTNVAVTESDCHDQHQLAQWSFVAIGRDTQGLDKVLDDIETYAHQLDAQIIESRRERS
mgnify:CR=1 FL=1